MARISLDTILQRPDIWQASARQRPADSLPTGFQALDECLHAGGWPSASLIEILPKRQGIGEWQLLLPTLAACSAEGRHTLLLSPPYMPYPPALALADIDPGKLLIIDSQHLPEQLWCIEQGLNSGAAACIVSWFGRQKLHTSHLRKLLLAARHSNTLLFIYRDGSMARLASPAHLRLALDTDENGQLQLEIIKQPGGWSGQTVTLRRPEPCQAPAANS